MIRPTPAASARSSSSSLLLLPCSPIRARLDAGPQGDRQLATGADVDAEALLGYPAGHRGAEEGLPGVVDVPAGEGGREVSGPGRRSASSTT